MDGRKTDIVPCGKCVECKKRRRNQWGFRLSQEMAVSQSVCFMTLTYAEEPLSFNGHATLRKSDLQRFFKRLRKINSRPIKYYAVGEYGSRYKRPHYHIILFNLDDFWLPRSHKFAKEVWQGGEWLLEQNSGTPGMVDIAGISMASIFYVVNYVLKSTWQPEQDDDDREPEFAVMSKRLGESYLTEAKKEWHTRELDELPAYVTMPNGTRCAMPRYFKKKVYNLDQRKKLQQEASQRPQNEERTIEQRKNIERRENKLNTYRKGNL